MERTQRQEGQDSKITDMLHLARIYDSGLGKLWQNQSEATRILGITYRDLRRGHLVCAAAVLGYPAEISSLFSAVGIGTSGVRSINKAITAQGLSTVTEKAIQIKATGVTYSRAQLVTLISSTGPFSILRDFNPRKIFVDYQQGLEEGRWSSMRSAAAYLQVDKAYIATACDFIRLPPEVTDLFWKKSCTYHLCRELIEIDKIYGHETLVRRARSVPTAAIERMSAREIANVISGLMHKSVTVIPRIRIPQSKKTIIVELHCTDSRFLLDRSDALVKIVEKGMAKFIETALVTLGASPGF